VRDVGTKVGRFAELFLAGLALARSSGRAREKSSRPAFVAPCAPSPRARDAACLRQAGPRAPSRGSPPRPSRPASLLPPTRGTGLAPLAPDSELCGRCLPFSFRAATPIPFRCPQTSETGKDRRPGVVSMASSASATCASETGPTRSLASLTAAPDVGLPTGSSRRVAPLGDVPRLPRCLRRHPVVSPRTAEPRDLPAGRKAPAPRSRGRCQTAIFQLRLRCSCLRVWAFTEISQTATAGQQGTDLWRSVGRSGPSGWPCPLQATARHGPRPPEVSRHTGLVPHHGGGGGGPINRTALGAWHGGT